MKAEKQHSGTTVQDVLRVFPGATVIAEGESLCCEHCRKESERIRSGGKKFTIIVNHYNDGLFSHRREQKDQLETPAWRRDGKIVLRTWPDGRSEWACSFCGRAADLATKQRPVGLLPYQLD